MGLIKTPESNIAIYLAKLAKVGILSRQRIDDGKLTSNGVYQYLLKKDLGRKNPFVCKDGVFDPNSDTLIKFIGVGS